MFSQFEKNGDFPTLAFPNPEEVGAMNLAKQTADENDVDVVIATDPDADRLGVAEKQPDGSWRDFTGNLERKRQTVTRTDRYRESQTQRLRQTLSHRQKQNDRKTQTDARTHTRTRTRAGFDGLWALTVWEYFWTSSY